MNKDDFNKYMEEDNERLKRMFGLEVIIKQTLWDAQIGDRNFNKTMDYTVSMMKKCVEDEDCKKQLYMIRKMREGDKPEKPTELETNLTNALVDADIEEEEFDETFANIINFSKRCVENMGYRKELYEINLDDYKPEEPEKSR